MFLFLSVNVCISPEKELYRQILNNNNMNNNKLLLKFITQDHHNNPIECLVIRYDALLILLPPSVNGYHNSTSSFHNRREFESGEQYELREST
jgi:hypothetical protein